MTTALRLPPPPVEPPPLPVPYPGPTHPTPTHPEAPPRPTRNHYAVNGRPYLAELELLTWCALELADAYEKKLTAIFARPLGQVGVR